MINRCPGCGNPLKQCECERVVLPGEGLDPADWQEHGEPQTFIPGSEKPIERPDEVGGV